MADGALAVRLGDEGSPVVSLEGRRIALVMPIARGVQGRTLMCIVELAYLLARCGATVVQAYVHGQSRVTMARTQAAAIVLAAERPCDAMLWIDDDMAFSAVDALRMIAQAVHDPKTPIVAAVGRKKTPDLSESYCCELDTEEDGGVATRGHLVAARRVGFALVAMTYQALRTTADLAIDEGRVIRMHEHEVRLTEAPHLFYEQVRGGWSLSEDYTFCEDARRAGLSIWIDASVTLGHIGAYEWSGCIGDHLHARTD